jgi:hypothetical protein
MPPQLGEHAAGILGKLGMSEQQIAELKKNSVVEGREREANLVWLPPPERGRVGEGVLRVTGIDESVSRSDPHPVCTQVGCFRLARHKRADIG